MSVTFTDKDGDLWHRCRQTGLVEFAGLLFRIGPTGLVECVSSEDDKWETEDGLDRTNKCAREAIAALWPEAERPNSTTPLLVAAPTPRRIVQLSTSDSTIVALCDDQTVWRYRDDGSFWTSLPDIPQD